MRASAFWVLLLMGCSLRSLDGFFDDFALPFEGGILFDVAQNVDVGFSIRFHHLVGPDAEPAWRGAYFLGRFRF